MIFVTVGGQLPFDRLIEIVDFLAPELSEPVIAQIGKSKYQAINIECRAFLGPKEFESLISSASRVVAHAGMGTVLAAKRLGKPLIIFPRRVEFREHRNDHQLATAKHLNGYPGVFVAWTKEELKLLMLGNLSVRPETDVMSPNLDLLSNFIREVCRTV